jgi:type IV fimbrial biogenesis protein FimT
MSARSLAGFTLLEMMATLAVLAILTAIAVPSFQTLFERNRLTSATNDLLGAFLAARSNAVTRRLQTRVCPSINGTACATGNVSWAVGWIVQEVPTPSPVLRIAPAMDSSLTVTPAAQTIIFDPAGNASGLANGANIQIANTSGERCIRIRASGQVTTEPDAC